MKLRAGIGLCCCFGLICVLPARAEESFAVKIRVDATKAHGELKPIWRFFGADEPNYAYMKDGKTLLSQLGEMRRGEVYFRTHN
jgi:xylan 1,4-beta-xylosidase